MEALHKVLGKLREFAKMERPVDMVIANGARMEALYDIVEGKNVGTRFSARRGALQ